MLLDRTSVSRKKLQEYGANPAFQSPAFQARPHIFPSLDVERAGWGFGQQNGMKSRIGPLGGAPAQGTEFSPINGIFS